MKYQYLPKSFVRLLSVVLCAVTLISVGTTTQGQDYRMRSGGPMTSNPAPAYPSSTPSTPAQPPAAGIQNPTRVNQPAQSMPIQGNMQQQNATSMPSNPFNSTVGVSTNPFTPTPSTGYGYGPNVAPVQQPTIQRNPFQVQSSSARSVQPATIGGQISTQPVKRPFDDQPPQSPYSPYMYLFAGRGGSGGGDNYNLYVRPMQQQEEYNRQMVQQVETLQQTIQRQQQQIQSQNRVLNQLEQEGVIPTQTGTGNNPNGAGQYYNQQYQQYFNTQGR